MLRHNAEIRIALGMRANYIETGDVNLSANDAIEYLESWKCSRAGQGGQAKMPPLPKTLTDEQKELVRTLRFLSRYYGEKSE